MIAIMAESAGIEPAQPFGLVAIAARCLAARPTPREHNMSPPSRCFAPCDASAKAGPAESLAKAGGVHGAIRTRSLRLRTPPLSPLSYVDKPGSRSRIRTCIAAFRAPHPAVRRSWSNLVRAAGFEPA